MWIRFYGTFQIRNQVRSFLINGFYFILIFLLTVVFCWLYVLVLFAVLQTLTAKSTFFSFQISSLFTSDLIWNTLCRKVLVATNWAYTFDDRDKIMKWAERLYTIRKHFIMFQLVGPCLNKHATFLFNCYSQLKWNWLGSVKAQGGLTAVAVGVGPKCYSCRGKFSIKALLIWLI